jgi:hypothetical protein
MLIRLVLVLVCFLLAACTTVPLPELADPGGEAFSHEPLDRFLERFVDEDGRVDYPGAAADRGDLERYLAAVAARSPDSHPELFPTEADRLAYWLNGYNAWVLRAVIEYYPIESVRDVPKPRALLLGGLARFFVGQKVTLGGDRMSLYHLENGIVRERFAEPRIHFALNCASRSCPRLPTEAFDAMSLERQLGLETRRFIGEARNVRVDSSAREVWLSAIFDWYESDFTSWLAGAHPERPATLLSYVALYAEGGLGEALAECADCKVRFFEYDWGLNAQR